MFGLLFSDPLAFFLDVLQRVPAVIIGFTVHEFSHAITADLLGDDTPRSQGRLTLNPGAHVDLVGLLMLIFMGFGWAKPVMIRPGNFRHPKLYDIFVSIAGPFSNLLLSFIFFALLRYLPDSSITPFIYAGYSVNAMLFFFNLLPIPPLDGFHVVKSLLGYKYLKTFWKVEQYGMIILIVLSFAGVLSTVLYNGTALITALFLYVLP